MIQNLKRLGAYMGKRKSLLPLSVSLSALNGLLSLIPFVFLWLVVRTLLMENGNLADTPLVSYAVAAFVLSLLSVLLYFLSLMLSHLAAFRIETNMRRSAMERLMQMPMGFFDTHNSGKMRKIIDEDSSQTHTLVAHLLPDVAASLVTPIGIIILLLGVDWQLGLAAMVPVLCAFLLMGYMMRTESSEFRKMYLDAQEKMSDEAVEFVRGIPVVKVFQQTVFSFKRFYDSIINYRDLVIRYSRGWRRPMSLYTVSINAFAFVLVPLSIILIGQTPKDFTIRFEDVSFRYEGAKEDAVKHITLTIPQGKTIALVGASGSGKTTLARLIPRFWDVREGCLSIGGTDVREMSKQELMQSVSFVFQNTRLFKTTLIDNIRYGSPESSSDSVLRAVDLSQSREIINRLPDGLNTLIGAEGTYLSGGEQQRIVLARAILKDAPIVVLDEATAFADPENEHLIRKALSQLTKGRTVLMIAHRLTSVKDADEIVVLDKGEIKEQGTHDELLRLNGRYCRMWNEYQKAIAWKI